MMNPAFTQTTQAPRRSPRAEWTTEQVEAWQQGMHDAKWAVLKAAGTPASPASAVLVALERGPHDQVVWCMGQVLRA